MSHAPKVERAGRRRALVLAVLLGLTALTAGCSAPKPHRDRPAKSLDWSGQTARSVVDMLREQRSKLGAISAYFSLSLPSPPPGQPSSLQGMLTVRFREGAPLARIQVLRPFGGVALDMVVDGENLAAYVPKTRTLYRGKAGELAGSAGQGPGTFFRFGLAGPRALKARQAELIVHQKDVVLKLSDGRLELDKQTGRIRRWETEQRQVIYSGYVPVGESAWLPGHIRLLSASGELLAECRLEDIRPLKAETGRFDLSEYPVEEMEDLRELLEGQR